MPGPASREAQPWPVAGPNLGAADMIWHHGRTRWSVDAHRIERARVLRAWTREHLARVAHVDPKTLADMCSGRRRPNLRTVQAVCTALDLTIGDIIVFDDDDRSPSGQSPRS